MVAAGLLNMAGAAVASADQRPAVTVVAPHWREVASDLPDLGSDNPAGPATNRYLLLETQQVGNLQAEPAYTLLNTSTDVKTLITTPPCENYGGAALSARYFATECEAVTATSTATSPYVYLLNLATGQWIVRQLSSTVCSAGCSLAGIGSTWIRIEVAPMDDHDLPSFDLQNIATGAILQADGPDNLDNATGVSQPCTTVPRDGLDADFLSSPSGAGSFTQLGRFLLSTGTFNANSDMNSPAVLRACHAKTQIVIPHEVAASSEMVVWQPAQDQSTTSTPRTNRSVYGLSVPGLRSFVIRQAKGPLVAVSNNTIYETVTNSTAATTSLWAATVPKSVLSETR
jgi:hypothetical protein